MVEAGFDDVLIANEVVEPGKIARLASPRPVGPASPSPLTTLSRWPRYRGRHLASGRR